ncbi:alpha/beta hydrolase [Lysinibacillus capsici]|uniref:alpha/beta hydrolase n=1 Tax=Lysinibacillus capsici TaxID=2115968 RepID=UPI003081A2A7|nr:alpha/beta hydrolase [Lysinibacillus capsici]
MKYEIFGDIKSDCIILALPPLGERKEFYIPLATNLNRFKWILCDLPGHNNNTNYTSINEYVDALERLIVQLGINKIHLVGSSIGAIIIQLFYRKYKKNVKSLFLLDGGYYFLGDRNLAVEKMKLEKIRDYNDIIEAVHKFTYSIDELRNNNYKQFEDYFIQNYIKVNDYYKHHCDVQTYNMLSEEVIKTNYCLRESIEEPIYLILAENNIDDYKRKKIKDFCLIHPTATVKVIENGHHYLSLVNTKQIKECLEKYLRYK